jgi:iron(III) transport system permease protein
MNLSKFFQSIIILLFIIILLPIFFMVITPFVTHSTNPLGRIFFDQRHLTLAKNSFELAVGTTFLSLIIGVPMAFLISRTNLWGSKYFGILYLIPILIPPYIHAIVWSHLTGIIKTFSSGDIHSLWGAVVVLTLAYFPFITLIAQSGLKSIDRNLEESSLLHCGQFHTIRRITLPLIAPHIFAGAIFVFIFSIIDFGVPDILRFNVYPVEIFIQFSAFYDEGAATLLSMPLIVITLFFIFLQRWYMKNRSYINILGGGSKALEFRLGKMNIFAYIFCLFIVFFSFFSVVIPLAVLLSIAGPLSSYVRVINTSIGQISYSVILASTGAFVALFLGFFLAYIIERSKAKWKNLLIFATFVPLAIPAVTLGIGLIKIWNRPIADFVYGSSFIIILGYIARFIPFSVITISSGLKQINQRLEEAAFLITPNQTKVMLRIVLPMLTYSLIAGFFVVFILSFGELGTTLLVIPPGRETIPIKIYNLMHYGADQMVAALCLILIIVIFTFSGLFFIIHKKVMKKALQ